MSRFLLATFVIAVLGANLAAQSPAPTSAPQTGPKSPAQSTPSPSATPTVEELVDSLGPADLQAFITLLKANFTNPDGITDTELSRADRKSTRLNSSHVEISYAVFCLKKKK